MHSTAAVSADLLHLPEWCALLLFDGAAMLLLAEVLGLLQGRLLGTSGCHLKQHTKRASKRHTAKMACISISDVQMLGIRHT